MLERLARFIIRRRKLVLALTAVFFAVAGVTGGGVAERLTSGGFDDPASEAAKTTRVLEDQYGVSNPDIVLLVKVDDDGATVDDPEITKAGLALSAKLEAEAGVNQVVSYWTLQKAPPFRSTDGTRAMVLANLEGGEDEGEAKAATLVEQYTRSADGISVSVGGLAAIYSEMSTTIEHDLILAESIAIPITVILLLFVFGSLVAASLPLAIGGMALLGSFAILRVLTSFTDVSIFSLNLTTGLSLGLAIDYSLLVVSRFREELAGGRDVEEAVVRTVATSGRTVIFSGVTVAVSLTALLVFPTVFLRSFAYAGIAVSILSVLGAIVVLPALLTTLGHRVDKAMLWRRSAKPFDEGFWRRTAEAVMARPFIAGGAVVLILGISGLPFLGIKIGLPDDRVLPRDSASRQVSDDIRENFNSREAGALTVVASEVSADRLDEITDSYASRLASIEGVARVDAATGSYIDGALALTPIKEIHGRFNAVKQSTGTWFSVIPSVEPLSPEGEALARRIRNLDVPFTIQVGGPSAALVDDKDSVAARLPVALLLIGGSMFVLLFMMFGSVVVPAKALVMNVLSLGATFGAMVFIFQDGHFADLLGFTPTGTIELHTPIMMFCLAFGLSMDYEVFLLSRIKEEYDRTGDNNHAVAMGLQRTGRIVTAAALLLSIVFGSFISSGVASIKLLGLGMVVAVLVDATLVRGVLVPAFMRLAGNANWWAPAPLRAFHDRFGISESAPELQLSLKEEDPISEVVPN